MSKLLITLVAGMLLAGTAAATEKDDVMVPVNQFTAALNKGDMKAAQELCADTVSIIDDVPPFEWHGAGACASWLAAFGEFQKSKGMSEGVMKLHPPRHVEVVGDRGYIVVTGTFSHKVKGKTRRETGALTIALQKAAAGWRMNAWAWTKR